MSKRTHWSKFFLGVIVGGTLGVLFAPKKGSDMRRELRGKMDDLIDRVKEIDTDEVRDKFFEKIEEINYELQDLDRERIKEIVLEKVALLKEKCEDLVIYAEEKGTPIVEKLSLEIRDGMIRMTEHILQRLEEE